MAKIEATLEESQGTLILPDRKWQHMIVSDKPICQKTKGNVETGSVAGNPMTTINADVYDGEFKGTRIFGHNIMTGGVTRAGGKMPTRTWREFVDAMAAQGVAWECKGCGNVGDVRFERTPKGQFVCPNCHQMAPFVVETDDFQNKRFNALIKTGTFFNSSEPRNEIERIRPYGEIVDGDGPN